MAEKTLLGRQNSAQAVSKLEGVATAFKNLCKLTRSRESFRTYSHQVTNEATVRAVVKNRPAFRNSLGQLWTFALAQECLDSEPGSQQRIRLTFTCTPL